ncbi:MAG: efflux RND transporter permease subunit [Deltaproteobacteria bacterium]|nr:efflux RND transporter permease subunit [Deltaproteobacteria bacterium]MBW2069750.1 efflux RND transporter permease subunit [Deltaproteobacteria bacterium]
MNLARFSVRNPVCVNLIMICILVMGVVLYNTQMPKEIFPEFSKNQVIITTIYPGASPEEIEKNVTIKIEDAINDLDDVDDIFSISQEGRSTVKLTVSPDVKSMAKLLGDLQQKIDQISDLPEDAEDPSIREVETNYPVITVSIYGNIDLLQLKEFVEDLKDKISALPGVADVRTVGLPERELWIEVAPESLERYDLTLADIARAVRSQNFDLPGGTFPTSRGEFLVRTVGKVSESRLLNNLVLKSTPDGGRVVLGDVARIKNWFERETSLGRFNGQRAVNLTVTKTKRGDAIKVSRGVQRLVALYRTQLPATVNVGVFNDLSIYIQNRLHVLKQNGLQGLLVVFLLLFLMLNTRVALLVTLGIPVSFLGAIILMHYAGMTMNMIAMFALIVVLGLVVDDAVVIGENVYRHYEAGLSPAEAAVKGTQEVAYPVVSAVATTVAAFLPLLLMPGTLGVFLGVIPKVVTFALLVSLFEALVILPSHLAEFLPRQPKPPGPYRHRLNQWINSIVGQYGRLLERVLNWRYVFVVLALAVSLQLVLYARYHIPFVLFGQFEGSQFFVNMETPTVNSLEDTEQLVARVEAAIRSSIPESELTSMVSNVGYIFDDLENVRLGSNLAQTIVELKDLDKGRKRPIKEVIAGVRQAIEPLRSEASIQIREVSAGPGGSPIYILLSGNNRQTLRFLANQVEAFVEQFPGVHDLKDNLEAGKPELQVRLKPVAYALGLDDRQVAEQLRNAFWGAKSSKFQTATEDIDVVVKIPEKQKKRLAVLLNFKLTLPDGSKIPLTEVANVVKVAGASQIIRDNQKRAIVITGELEQNKTTTSELAAAVRQRFHDISQKYPGYSLSTERGEMKEINESLSALTSAFLLGLLLIYFILGTQFRSYLQPLIVMAAIPFGIDGVILGHIVMGKTIGIMSMIGLVALSGIVVNDSLVLVDFINKKRGSGLDRHTSIVQSGKVRFRPVVLTSVTTMGGLFFLAFLAKGQARFLSPMAIAIFYGLMASTVITLLLVPCLYAILDDVVLKCQRQSSGLRLPSAGGERSV